MTATASLDTAPEEGRFVVLKTIGLIGGMSWESTVSYYRLINTAVQEKLGGLHSAKCVLYSVDFAEIGMLQQQGRWAEATQVLVAAGQSVERAGADLVLLCTNTMHKVAEALQGSLHILFQRGADGIILGCTELGLLTDADDTRVPLFDTIRIHALAAVRYVL